MKGTAADREGTGTGLEGTAVGLLAAAAAALVEGGVPVTDLAAMTADCDGWIVGVEVVANWWEGLKGSSAGSEGTALPPEGKGGDLKAPEGDRADLTAVETSVDAVFDGFTAACRLITESCLCLPLQMLRQQGSCMQREQYTAC